MTLNHPVDDAHDAILVRAGIDPERAREYIVSVELPFPEFMALRTHLDYVVRNRLSAHPEASKAILEKLDAILEPSFDRLKSLGPRGDGDD